MKPCKSLSASVLFIASTLLYLLSLSFFSLSCSILFPLFFPTTNQFYSTLFRRASPIKSKQAFFNPISSSPSSTISSHLTSFEQNKPSHFFLVKVEIKSSNLSRRNVLQICNIKEKKCKPSLFTVHSPLDFFFRIILSCLLPNALFYRLPISLSALEVESF